MSAHQLAVFHEFSRLGTIGFEPLDETFSFGYHPAWLNDRAAFPLSPHFPLTGEPFSSAPIRRFLENLLPEGRALDIAATTFQVSKSNIFGLVRELGRETAGALTFLPEDDFASAATTEKRPVGVDELARRVRERAEHPLSVWDGRVRMSLAGYQDKLAVLVDGEDFYLAEGRLASTHILKPEPPHDRLPHLAANEHFCTNLARRIGLPVPDVDILRLPDPVLIVRRFDRARGEDAVHRRHIIDACQALDFPVSYKYERNFGSGKDVRHIRDGVSFRRLFSVAAHCAVKAVATQLLLRWALLQFLLGNCDAHGKNISFFCGPEGLSVAPFYDLVSVVQFSTVDHEMAMGYGDEFVLEHISPFDWACFAGHAGVPRSLLAREMGRTGRAARRAALEQSNDPVYVDGERAAVKEIADFVARQADRMIDSAQPMRQVSASLL